MTNPTETTVRRYYAVVADLTSSEADLLEVLDPDSRFVEHPNPVVPTGATRDVEQALAGFRAGRRLLSAQTFDLHEVLVSGERAAVRATWSGTIAVDAGRYQKGMMLTAHIAGFLTVRDGRVVDHETFDCYAPLDE